MFKNILLPLLCCLFFSIQAQIDLVNDNIGIGLLNPTVPIQLKGDLYKFQNEAGADLFHMNSSGNIGIGKAPTGHKLDINGNLSVGGRNLYLGGNRFYSNNASVMYLYNNHSSVTQLIMMDKEGTQYGRLYGSGNGSQFGLLDGDANWSYFAVKDNYTQLRINDVPQMQIEGGSTWMRPSQLQIGWAQSGNRYAYIDLQGDDTYTDYGLRLIRASGGANTHSQLVHRGTGALEIITYDQGDMNIKTNNATRITVKGKDGISGPKSNLGWVGIGVTNPTAMLHVNGNIKYAGSIINASDKRLKKNVEDFEYGIKEVVKLNPVSFQYNEKVSDLSGRRTIGLLAQELQKVAPNLVSTFEEPLREVDKNQSEKKLTEYLGIEESAIKYMLINAIKEQQIQIEEQGRMIAELQEYISVSQTSTINGHRIQIALENSEKLLTPYLSQNIPNPTNHDALIKYFIPEHTSNAVIRFFNLNGQILKEVPITEKGQGELDLEVDQIISGSYIYSLIVDGQLVDSKSMIIAR